MFYLMNLTLKKDLSIAMTLSYSPVYLCLTLSGAVILHVVYFINSALIYKKKNTIQKANTAVTFLMLQILAAALSITRSLKIPSFRCMYLTSLKIYPEGDH